MARYSFPIQPNTEARVHHENGRVEITFVPMDAAVVASGPTSTALPGAVAPSPTARPTAEPNRPQKHNDATIKPDTKSLDAPSTPPGGAKKLEDAEKEKSGVPRELPDATIKSGTQSLDAQARPDVRTAQRLAVPASVATAPMANPEPVAEAPSFNPGVGATRFIPSVDAVLNEPITLANIDMAVPESPTFAALGISQETVIRPTSPRAFAASLLNGVDENGNFQTGLGFDTAPFLLFAGNEVTLEEYQTDYVTRLLSRTQLSFAGSKGAEEEDKSIRIALALQLTLFDNGDPRLDEELLQDFSNALHAAGGMAPIGFGPEAEEQIADVNARFAEGVAAAHARRKAERRNWNASSWSLGVAPSWINQNGESGSFEWNGAIAWTSIAYGFENVEALKDKAQLIGHIRYRSREEVPDPNGQGSFLSQDSFRIGGRLRVGAPDFNCSLDGAWVQEWPDHGQDDSVYLVAFSIERRMAKNVWLSLSFGKEFDHENGENPMFFVGGLKIGYSPEPVLSRERPQSFVRLTNRGPPSDRRVPASERIRQEESIKGKTASPDKLRDATIERRTQSLDAQAKPGVRTTKPLRDATIKSGTKSLDEVPSERTEARSSTGKPKRLEDAEIKKGTKGLDAAPSQAEESRSSTGKPKRLEDAEIKKGTKGLDAAPSQAEESRSSTEKQKKLKDAEIKKGTKGLDAAPSQAEESRSSTEKQKKLEDAEIKKGTKGLDAVPSQAEESRSSTEKQKKLKDAEIKKGTKGLDAAPSQAEESRSSTGKQKKLKDAEIKKGTKGLDAAPSQAEESRSSTKKQKKLKDAEIKKGTKGLDAAPSQAEESRSSTKKQKKLKDAEIKKRTKSLDGTTKPPGGSQKLEDVKIKEETKTLN